MNIEERKELAELLFPNIKHDRNYYENMYPERTLKKDAMVTRFGPSPTGFVHMGSLLVSFINSIFAKQSNGVFFLRIEDTDQKRAVENGVEGIYNDLKAFEINPSESPIIGGNYGPYIQSKRTEIYQTYVKDLIIKGLAYPCFMTEDEIASIKEEQEINKTKLGIYGIYAADRDLSLEEIKQKIASNEEYVIRLKSPGDANKQVEIIDCIKGKMKFPEHDMDTVLLKKDGTPTYHLAHAIDDHLMHTTHVIRGDEWVSSLPLHIQLFNLLGFTHPKYAHIAPLTKKENGNTRKLSKRKDPEAAVSYYDEMGIPIDAVKLYLATILNSNFEEWRLQNMNANIFDFKLSFDKMTLDGALFDLAKVKNICKERLARLNKEEFTKKAYEYACKYDENLKLLIEKDKEYFKAIINIEREKENPRKDYETFKDIYPIINFFYNDLYEELLQNELPFNRERFDNEVIIHILSNFKNNMGLCFANEEFFREEIVNGSVKKVKVIEELFDDNIYIVYKKGKNIININKFIKILKKQYEEELQ